MTPEFAGHPKLARPPLSEAVFEFRYEPPKNPGVVPGRIFDRLKDLYVGFEDLPAAQIPAEIVPTNTPRHRLISEDGHRLALLGTGTISVNHTRYGGYDAFAKDSRALIEGFRELSIATHVKRLGLRYINRLTLDRDVDDLIAVRVEMPDPVGANAVRRQLQWLTAFGDLGYLTTRITAPAGESEGQEYVLLDFDFYNEEHRELEARTLMEWHGQAHELIYDAFKGLLTTKYFQEVQGGSRD